MNIELVNVVLLALMQIDRLFVQRGKGAGVIHFADDSRLVRGRFDDHKIVGTDAAQGDRVRRIGLAGPVPLVAGAMDESALGKVLENLSERRDRRIVSSAPNGSSNVAHCRWLMRIWMLSGLTSPRLRRLVQEVLGMIDDVLIQRRARRHHHRHRHSAAAAGASHALPGRSDRSGIAGKHRDIEAADIDAQFQRVRRNHAANAPVAQAALDLTPLIGQIAAAIADDGFLRRRPGFDSRLQVAHENLGDQPAVGENDRRNVALQERRRDLLRLVDVRAPNAQLPIHDRRVVEEDVLLAFAGAALAMNSKGSPVSRSASSCGLAIVADVQMNCGRLP